MGPTTRSVLASLLALLMVLVAGIAPVTATGRSDVHVSRCFSHDDDLLTGIKVYSKDNGRGANRVMCAYVYDFWEEGEWASSLDTNLNRRAPGRHWMLDIWNGFRRDIESFKLWAPKGFGCHVDAVLTGWHRGQKFVIKRSLRADGPHKRLFEIPERKDNKVTKIALETTCSH